MSGINEVAIILAAATFLVILTIGWIEQRLRRRRLNPAKFHERWQNVQSQCRDKSTWPLAVIDADKLLDEALKKRGFKGNTMGERLVNARKSLTNNDKAWFAHKLRNKLVHEDEVELTESAVKTALKAERQALRDLGALK